MSLTVLKIQIFKVMQGFVRPVRSGWQDTPSGRELKSQFHHTKQVYVGVVDAEVDKNSPGDKRLNIHEILNML